jgi:hypothetical protein
MLATKQNKTQMKAPINSQVEIEVEAPSEEEHCSSSRIPMYKTSQNMRVMSVGILNVYQN